MCFTLTVGDNLLTLPKSVNDYSKPCFKWPLKIDKTKVLMTNISNSMFCFSSEFDWSVGKIKCLLHFDKKVSKGAKIRNRYNQVPHLTQDTNGKVTNSQLDTTNESQEVSPFPAGDHKAHINRRSQRHSKHKTEKTHIKDQQKKYRLGTVSKYFTGGLKPV